MINPIVLHRGVALESPGFWCLWLIIDFYLCVERKHEGIAFFGKPKSQGSTRPLYKKMKKEKGKKKKGKRKKRRKKKKKKKKTYISSGFFFFSPMATVKTAQIVLISSVYYPIHELSVLSHVWSP